jgi:predicted AAA+ superfamily ATPase
MQITNLQKKTIDLLNPWWFESKFDFGIKRRQYLKKIDLFLKKRSQILFLLGSRRVGKTRIILQYISKLINSGTNPKKILFLSLDNTNLYDFNLFDFLTDNSFDFIFLDEIQYLVNWPQILKSIYDLPRGRGKIICSGSSSKLIEDSKAFLTGRSSNIDVLPLDFIEFKVFSKSSSIKDYLRLGGYPEYVLEKEPNYLNDLIRDIIEKDIIRVNKLKNGEILFDICQILAKQIGFKTTSNKISNVLKVDNKTVVSYMNYLKQVRLVDSIYQYSQSLNKRLYSPKKYYFMDLGIRNSLVGFTDIGSLVENSIFISLSKKYGSKNIYYLSDQRSKEVDFVVDLGQDKLAFFESKYLNLQSAIENSISNIFTKDINDKKVVSRVIVTDGIDNITKIKDCTVSLVSLSKFLDTFKTV